jgi:hypothetical protein
MNKLFLIISVSLILSGCAGSNSERVKQEPIEDEKQLAKGCTENTDCMVVDYSHCCGSTKRAINKKYLDAYESHPEWQTFNGSLCAVMGMCRPDQNVKTAVCEEYSNGDKECALEY